MADGPRSDLLSDLLSRPWHAAVIGFGLLAAYAVLTVGSDFWSLTLNDHFLSPSQGRWLTIWLALGGASAALLAPAVATVAVRDGWADRVSAFWARGTDAQWCGAAMVLAFVVPAVFRLLILDDLPLVADESTYRFSARILATGHLTVPSHPYKLFFDNGLVVNDGRMYTQYFLGWPALLVPFVVLGIPGFANAVYAALTVPAVFLVARRLAGSGWARVALLLFLTSPMLMIGASNEMAHTTTFGLLAWLLWSALRSRDPDAPVWSNALVGLCFGAAFFARPTSTVGTGLPVLIWWAWTWLWLPRGQKLGALGAFLVPAAAMGIAFLWVNAAQNGGITKVAYYAYFQYMERNEQRFAGLDISSDQNFPINSFNPFIMVRVVVIAAIRTNAGLHGWPASLIFAPFARARGTCLLWAMALCHFSLHMPLIDVGVETYGPVHYFEASLPLLLLTVLGLRHVSERMAGNVDLRRRAIPYAFLGTLVTLSLVGYWPVHAHALRAAATTVARPMDAVAHLERAVVFAPRPFAVRCPQDVTWNWMLWHPNSDPELYDDILWVNHISTYADRKLMREVFPKRKGYVLHFEEPCTWSILDLSDPDLFVLDQDIGGSRRLDPEYLPPPDED